MGSQLGNAVFIVRRMVPGANTWLNRARLNAQIGGAFDLVALGKLKRSATMSASHG